MEMKTCWGERKDENRAHQSWPTQFWYWKCKGREKDDVEFYSVLPASTLNTPFWAPRCHTHSGIVLHEVTSQILVPSVCVLQGAEAWTLATSLYIPLAVGQLNSGSPTHGQSFLINYLLLRTCVCIPPRIIPPTRMPPCWIYEVLNQSFFPTI